MLCEPRAGHGDQLTLAERESAPSLLHLGLIAVLEAENELVGADSLG